MRRCLVVAWLSTWLDVRSFSPPQNRGISPSPPQNHLLPPVRVATGVPSTQKTRVPISGRPRGRLGHVGVLSSQDHVRGPRHREGNSIPLRPGTGRIPASGPSDPRTPLGGTGPEWTGPRTAGWGSGASEWPRRRPSRSTWDGLYPSSPLPIPTSQHPILIPGGFFSSDVLGEEFQRRRVRRPKK